MNGIHPDSASFMEKANNEPFDQTVAGWLLTLRWGTVLCQVILFAAVHLLFTQTVSDLVLVLIAFEVASNLLFSWLIQERRQIPLGLLTGVMFLDVALLTGLLALTGGAMNPFTFLYLVHIVVGAILLPRIMSWGLAAFSTAGYGLFFWPGLKLPALANHADCHSIPLSPELKLHLQGMWVAYVITAAFVVFFVTRIQNALGARRETQARLKEEQYRNERLASLAALSAGAAHEFATPLSTIAVATGELYREMRQVNNEDWLRDLELIRSQVNRCREILYQMAADAGEQMGEGIETLAIAEVNDTIRSSLDQQRQKRLLVECAHPEARVTLPRRSVIRVVRGLVSNAFHASDAEAPVRLRVWIDQETLQFEVKDQGRGMDREMVRRAREPFFTTKSAGQGLGLGLYLAEVLAERLGGGLELDSTVGVGTTVRFWVKTL